MLSRSRSPAQAGEIQLTDAMLKLMETSPLPRHAFLKARRSDTGSKTGYLRATVAYGLADPEHGAEVRQYSGNLAERLTGRTLASAGPLGPFTPQAIYQQGLYSCAWR